MSLAGVVVLAGQLVQPAIVDDARTVPSIESALDAHLDAGSGDENLVASWLLALERLDPESALVRARRVLRQPVDGTLSLAAHGVAVRAGDGDAVRSALAEYSRDPAAWRRILGDAAVATDDVRLSAFAEFAALPAPANDDVFRTTLLRYLGDERAHGPPPRAAADAPSTIGTTERAEDFVAMYRIAEVQPDMLLRWLDSGDAALRERAQRVMALSAEPSRLPLLIELAVTGRGSGRRAAFRALAEMELGDFDLRLHRLAGDADRTVRFETALALVPSGDEWALRLLFAELDATSALARRRARRSLERLDRADAVAHLETLATDGIATPFAVEVYLQLTGRDERRIASDTLWAMLAPHVEAEDPLALIAAARLEHAEAEAAVRAFVERLDRR